MIMATVSGCYLLVGLFCLYLIVASEFHARNKGEVAAKITAFDVLMSVFAWPVWLVVAMYVLITD